MKKLYKQFCKAEEVVTSIMFFSIVGLTFASSFFRLLRLPLIWADDVCLLLFAWTAFFGADVAMRYHRLVGVDILTNKLPHTLRKTLQCLVYLIMMTILAILGYSGIKLGINSWDRSFNSLSGFSYSWVTFSLPVGCFLMIITCCVKLGKLIPNIKDINFDLKKDFNAQSGMDNIERQS